MSGIELDHIVKRYGLVDVIRDISLRVEQGEFVVFLGPSGCGKSTLLRMVAGLESISGGEIRLGGRRIDGLPPGQRGVAMVFQSYALYPHMTVRENFAFGLKNINVSDSVIESRIVEAGRVLEIGHLLDRKPVQLSGGQRQRVAIGRAIVKEPQAFLFDEPLSNLDAGLRARTRVEIARLHQRLGATMIFVTHDQVEAMTLATRIVVLNQGRIEQVGTPLEIYRTPATRFVAAFIGSPAMNFLGVTGLRNGGPGVKVDVAGATIDTGIRFHGNANGLSLGVRPDALHIDPAGQIPGRVEVVERLGDRTHVHTQIGDQVVIAEAPGDSPVAVGELLRLGVDPSQLHLFDSDGRAFHVG